MKHYLKEQGCACGKAHTAPIDDILVGKGVVARLPEFIHKYGAKKPFLLADVNTWAAAGEAVTSVLDAAGIPYSKYVSPCAALEPNEEAVGAVFMHFDCKCDLVITVGSGVLNDIGKILSNVHGCPYIIVGTAPSMDGYASASSSMSMDGLKVSLPTRVADVIIGDVDILKNAPDHLLKAGLGDMLAKYISIAEWRIAHIITGEYYCEEVAQLIRTALKKCTDNAAGLLQLGGKLTGLQGTVTLVAVHMTGETHHDPARLLGGDVAAQGVQQPLTAVLVDGEIMSGQKAGQVGKGNAGADVTQIDGHDLHKNASFRGRVVCFSVA